MATNKTFLPDKESKKGKELAKLYPTAPSGQLEKWTNQFGYGNKKNFISSMRDVYGIRRVENANEGWEPASINVPLKVETTEGKGTVAVINDTHNPYQDQITLDLVENFLYELQPQFLIYDGDTNDFYPISPFDKNPNRIDSLQSDIDNTVAMFRRHKRGLPKTKRILIDGNHEDRLRRFLWTKAPQLESLRCLKFEELFELDELGIEHIAYEQGLMINDSFLILHSDIASIHSGYTAKRLYEKHGGCGIGGHCHRGGSFYKRDRFGTWGWWENFCLCHLNPDWIKNPNWEQGFSLVHFIGKRFWVEQIPIIDHEFLYGGKLYS